MQKYAFVDRDGTIIWEPKKPKGADPRNAFPLKSMKEFKFMKGAISGMKKLQNKGYKLVLVTNQPFLGTDKHPRKMFDHVMDRIDRDLAKKSLYFEYKMICPHGPDENCKCRKPKTGGLKVHKKIDLKNSLMFGDRDTDKEFAKNLGVKFIEIKTNKEFVIPDTI